MKTPEPLEENPSAPNSASLIRIGQLPKQVDTVIAEVLSRLLRGEQMTGMQGVFEASTMRLSSVIHALSNIHGWDIERDDLAVSCNDGRTATVERYWLPAGVIEAAHLQGVHEWCSQVRIARDTLRKKKVQSLLKTGHGKRRRAGGANLTGQGDLFVGGSTYG